MNIEELNIVKKTHENTFISVLNIIEKYLDDVPKNTLKNMLCDLENYQQGITYQLDECISSQSFDFESEMLEMQNAGIDHWEGFALPDELDQATDQA